jgi:hypothetical protein
MIQEHVLATFTRRAEAAVAVERAAARFPDGNARLGDDDDALDALALGQEAEVGESTPILAAGIFTGPYARGALLWGAVGALVGAIVGVVLVLLMDAGDGPRWWLVGAFALAGALAVSSYTFVMGAGRQAIKEGETTPEDPTAVVRVDVRVADAQPVVELLGDAGARSVHLVDAPVPRRPTAEVERPRPSRPEPRSGSRQRDESDAGFRPDVR